MVSVSRALISVSDKTGVVDFARYLSELGIEILSTGGTAKALSDAGVRVRQVSDYTGFPEMMEGRVKTLHPKIHGALLALRSDKSHMEQAGKHDIELIDMVVVNLYPFEKTIARPNVKLEEAIENIDIGGPALIRSAAKNHASVAVVVNPARYGALIEELRRSNRELSDSTRASLALEAFQHTAHYDSVISNYLGKIYEKGNGFPKFLNLSYEKIQELRYGENPHQKAALYKSNEIMREACIPNAKQLHGIELSYNNLLDVDSALALLKEFDEPATVIVKHNNPCGVGIAEKISDAFSKAFSTDPEAAYGGVYALNRKVDAATAEKLVPIFVDVILAPAYDEKALEMLRRKKNTRVLEMGEISTEKHEGREFRSVLGGLLAQERNIKLFQGETRVVTRRKPTQKEMKMLEFAWKVCKHVKSNAIVYALEDRTIGIGAGQMKRVDSSKIGVLKALSSPKGTVLASDAFLPFRDSVDAAAMAGVTAIIQPGGSKRDPEVIRAANEHRITMVFTGIRQFRH
ncbi:MAG: bifunctional phosphoribosylaminoimidazolecarboxamide formyltransferase/IMP cyclohydrolase [Candidatus Micrarchaeota archaeon]